MHFFSQLYLYLQYKGICNDKCPKLAVRKTEF